MEYSVDPSIDVINKGQEIIDMDMLCISWNQSQELNRNSQKNTSTQITNNILKNCRRLRRAARQEEAKPQAVHRVKSLECTRCVPHADIQAVPHCSSTDSHIALGHHGNKLSIVNAAILEK